MHPLLLVIAGFVFFAVVWRVLRWALRAALLVLVFVGFSTCRPSGIPSMRTPRAARPPQASPEITALPAALRDVALGR